MTTRFAEKLDGLPATAALLVEADVGGISAALLAGRRRHAISVGSGGSAITAAFLARCRETLLGASPAVATPMDLVLGAAEIAEEHLWLFSAGADNGDIIAAVDAARIRRPERIDLVTRGADGAAARALDALPNAAVHTVPVAETKDGFLATHSLVAATGALLLACDLASEDPIGADLAPAFVAAVREAVGQAARRSAREMLASLTPNDTLVIIADPQLAAVAALIETSAWETALCAVQRTDARSLAHGRHTWLHHRESRTFMLALTGLDTRQIWAELAAGLPPGIRRASMDFGDCGRFRNAVGLVQGLVAVEAIGLAVGIDPGKPGIGDFGHALYASNALREMSARLGAAVRQKRAALLARDDPARSDTVVCGVEIQRLEAMAAQPIGGIVLDYDGTIVTNNARLDPPPRTVVDELVRLHRAGIVVAIATGRGGSAGEMLREVFPKDMHAHVFVGYYNGGYLQPLDVDIVVQPAPRDPLVAETDAWLRTNPWLFEGAYPGRDSGVQIAIPLSGLRRPEEFERNVTGCPPIASGAVRISRSGHSYDLFPAAVSKIAVVGRVREKLGEGPAIICVGDSGARYGNDNEMLSCPFGISVGRVCGRHDGCWSLFGTDLTGPDALVRLLGAFRTNGSGETRLDIVALGLDNAAAMSSYS